MLRGPLPTTVIQRWFNENPRIRSAGTRKQWGGHLRRLEHRYPDKRVNEYTAEDLRDFLLFEPNGTPTARAHTTIAAVRCALVSFFGWAHFVGLHPHDLTNALRRLVVLNPRPVREHLWLQPHELQAVFQACYADRCELLGQRDALAIALAVQCGLRVHELSNLCWGDLNLRNGTASILGKGEKLATVALPKNLTGLLTQWHNTATDGLGRLPNADDPVLIAFRHEGGTSFNSKRGLVAQWDTPCGINGLRTAIKKRGATIGLPQLAPHDLRRTFAGRLEDSGLPLRAIQHALRHSSVATTERYLANNPTKWRDQITNALDDLELSRRAG